MNDCTPSVIVFTVTEEVEEFQQSIAVPGANELLLPVDNTGPSNTTL